MAKQQSDATKVTRLRRDLRYAERNLRIERERANTALRGQLIYRERATKAEQEVADWKRRFDALLARTPDAGSPEGGR